MSRFFWVFVFLVLVARVYFYFDENLADLPEGARVRISGVVSSDPIIYENSQRVRIAGKVMYLPLYPRINYGDKVDIEAEVKDSQLVNAFLIDNKESAGFLYTLRQRLVGFYSSTLPRPHDALVSGMVLGARSNMPVDFWQKLTQTSTAHVVVASGMNVTLVSKFLIVFLSTFLARRRAIPFALIGVWFYAVLSGFDAPIVRASIMGSIAFLGQEFGRVASAMRNTVLACLGMLLVKPEWIQDVGFLLSVSATLALILFELPIRKRLKRVPKFIREDLSTSLAAQIGVLPIQLVSFGNFTPFGPLINTTMLWTVVPITIIGAISGAIGLVVPFLGRLILYISYPLTSWFILVVQTIG